MEEEKEPQIIKKKKKSKCFKDNNSIGKWVKNQDKGPNRGEMTDIQDSTQTPPTVR